MGTSEANFLVAGILLGLAVFGTYLYNLNVLFARELAERDLGQRRLVEVALECGFDSQSHFCRLFRQRFGMTPGEAMEQGRSARARRSLVDGDGPSRPEFRDWLLSL